MLEWSATCTREASLVSTAVEGNKQMGWKDLLTNIRQNRSELPISWRGLKEQEIYAPVREATIAKRSYITAGIGVSLALGIAVMSLLSVGYQHLSKPTVSEVANLNQDEEKEAFSMMGMATSNAEAVPADQLANASLELHSPGRLDPFAPLLDDYRAQSGEKERDILDGVSFMGYVDEPHTKKKVAIIKISDPSGDKSLVKKTGDSFEIEGHKIVIKDVRDHMLQLNAGGKSRQLELVDYNNDPAAMSGSGSTQTASASTSSSPGIIKLPDINSSNKDSGAAKDSTSKDTPKADPAAPKLQEP